MPVHSQVFRFRPTGRGVDCLDLAYSSNLYLTPRQGALYEAVRLAPDYIDAVVAPLRQSRLYLPTLLRLFRGATARPLALYDCGPADPDEVVSLAMALQQTCRLHSYTVVDINSALLTDSMQKLSEVGTFRCDVVGRLTAFEDFSIAREYLPGSIDAVMMFGATGLNYRAPEFARLLREMSTPDTLIAIQSLITPLDRSERAYQNEAVRSFTFEPIRLVGGKRRDFRFDVVRRSDRLDFEFVAQRRVTLNTKARTVLARGQRIRTAFSRRQSWDRLGRETASLFGRRLSLMSDNGATLTVGVQR